MDFLAGRRSFDRAARSLRVRYSRAARRTPLVTTRPSTRLALEPVSTLRVDQGNSIDFLFAAMDSAFRDRSAVSAWRLATPVRSFNGHQSRALRTIHRRTFDRSHRHTSSSRLTLRSVDIDRRRPGRVILARPSRRRVDLHRNLDSVRAPAIPWTIGGNPLRMCGPGSLLFYNPLFANASLWKSIRENGPGIREGVDPIGSLGGVHLSLDRPIRFPHVRSSPSRRARVTSSP